MTNLARHGVQWGAKMQTLNSLLYNQLPKMEKLDIIKLATGIYTQQASKRHGTGISYNVAS